MITDPGMIAPDFDLEEVDMEVSRREPRSALDRHQRQKPEKPFFFFHSLQAVHLPSFPGKRFQWQGRCTVRTATLSFQFDHVVGALLIQVGEIENCGCIQLVIVTSDNGPEVLYRDQYEEDA